MSCVVDLAEIFGDETIEVIDTGGSKSLDIPQTTITFTSPFDFCGIPIIDMVASQVEEYECEYEAHQTSDTEADSEKETRIDPESDSDGEDKKNIDPGLEQPPGCCSSVFCSPVFIHHVDVRAQAESRRVELEDLRQRSLAKTKAARLDNASAPSELADFFDKQREMNLEQREKQRDAIEFLHGYRADEQLVLGDLRRNASKDSESSRRHSTDSAWASASANAITTESPLDQSWKEEGVKPYEQLHSFRPQEPLLFCSSAESGAASSKELSIAPTSDSMKAGKTESVPQDSDGQPESNFQEIRNEFEERLKEAVGSPGPDKPTTNKATIDTGIQTFHVMIKQSQVSSEPQKLELSDIRAQPIQNPLTASPQTDFSDRDISCDITGNALQVPDISRDVDETSVKIDSLPEREKDISSQDERCSTLAQGERDTGSLEDSPDTSTDITFLPESEQTGIDNVQDSGSHAKEDIRKSTADAGDNLHEEPSAGDSPSERTDEDASKNLEVIACSMHTEHLPTDSINESEDEHTIGVECWQQTQSDEASVCDSKPSTLEEEEEEEIIFFTNEEDEMITTDPGPEDKQEAQIDTPSPSLDSEENEKNLNEKDEIDQNQANLVSPIEDSETCCEYNQNDTRRTAEVGQDCGQRDQIDKASDLSESKRTTKNPEGASKRVEVGRENEREEADTAEQQRLQNETDPAISSSGSDSSILSRILSNLLQEEENAAPLAKVQQPENGIPSETNSIVDSMLSTEMIGNKWRETIVEGGLSCLNVSITSCNGEASPSDDNSAKAYSIESPDDVEVAKVQQPENGIPSETNSILDSMLSTEMTGDKSRETIMEGRVSCLNVSITSFDGEASPSDDNSAKANNIMESPDDVEVSVLDHARCWTPDATCLEQTDSFETKPSGSKVASKNESPVHLTMIQTELPAKKSLTANKRRRSKILPPKNKMSLVKTSKSSVSVTPARRPATKLQLPHLPMSTAKSRSSTKGSEPIPITPTSARKTTLKYVPLYARRPTIKATKKEAEPICSLKYTPNLHKSLAACERCLYWASQEEREKFAAAGHHLRIMKVRGGCDRGCAVFPRESDEFQVRLCKKCFYDTHKKAPKQKDLRDDIYEKEGV